MKNHVSRQQKSPVKFCAITIAACRIEEVAKLRNHPPCVDNNPDKSTAVRSEAEAEFQQWADNDR